MQALEDTGGGAPTAANFWRAAAILAAETGVVHRIEWWRSHGFTIDGRPLDAWFADRVVRDAPELVQGHHDHDQVPRATGQCDRCRAWTGGDFGECRCRATAHGHMRDGTPVAVLNEPAPPMTVCPDCGAWSGGIGRFEGCRCRR